MSEQDDDIDFGADLEAALGGEDTAPPEEGVEKPVNEAFPSSKTYSRDDAGRFAQKQAEEAAAAAKAPADPASQPWRPMWYKDEFGDWQKMPEPFRNALKERESAFERKLQEVGQPANTWKSLEQKIAPYAQELAASGVQPAQYFEQLHAANEYLRTDPEAAIKWLADSQGVDLIALADKIYAEAGGQQQQPADPQISQLQQHIARLEQQLGGVTSFQQQTLEQQRQAELNKRLSEVDEFAKDKPHFDALEPTMVRLMKGGEANGLADAYEKASWLHPEVRERILADQRKTGVSRARAAAQSPRNGAVTNGRAASRPTMSLEEEIGSLLDGGL
jgi:hypothetical protein